MAQRAPSRWKTAEEKSDVKNILPEVAKNKCVRGALQSLTTAHPSGHNTDLQHGGFDADYELEYQKALWIFEILLFQEIPHFQIVYFRNEWILTSQLI